MPKAQIVKYTCVTREMDPCRGTRVGRVAFLALEILGERPVVAVKLEDRMLVFPIDRKDRAAVLPSFHEMEVAEEILAGKKEVLKEIPEGEVSQHMIDLFLKYVDALRPGMEGRSHLANLLERVIASDGLSAGNLSF